MSKRQFWLGLLAVVVMGCAVGPVGYFAYQSSLDSHAKEVKLEQERTERSINRWETVDKMLKRLPFMNRD